MKRLRLFKGLAALAAVGLASAVFGRYGDLFAVLLRPDVLLGTGVVATLVALNTLESRHAALCQSLHRGYGRRVPRAVAGPLGPVVTLWQPENTDRKAA